MELGITQIEKIKQAERVFRKLKYFDPLHKVMVHVNFEK